MPLALPTERTGLLADWLAENVRVTFFVSPAVRPTHLWSRLVGALPSVASERPAESVRIEVGDFDAGGLFVTQQPGRIDILYGPKADDMSVQMIQANVQRLQHIGPAAAAISAVLRLVDQDDIPGAEINRVAFGLVLVRSASTNAETNQLILRHIELPIGESDTEVLWQVNKPVKAETFHGRINRIVKWQGLEVQRAAVLFGAPLHFESVTYRSQRAMDPSVAFLRFARFELDVNTVQNDDATHPFQHHKRVLAEVIDCASSILLQGGR